MTSTKYVQVPKVLTQEMDEAIDRARKLGSNQHLWDEAIAAAPQQAQAGETERKAQGLPSGYAVKHVEEHGWIIDPPNGSRWIAYEGTPAGDFITAITALQPQPQAVDDRESFEKAAIAEGFNVQRSERDPELYDFGETNDAFWGYRLGRASLSAQPTPVAAELRHLNLAWEERLSSDASSHLRIFGMHIEVFPVICENSGNTTHYGASYRVAESDDWHVIKSELPNREEAKRFIEQWLSSWIDEVAAHPVAGQSRDDEPTCVCAEPEAPNTVHRTDGPCYQAEQQADAGGDLDHFRGVTKMVEVQADAGGEPTQSIDAVMDQLAADSRTVKVYKLAPPAPAQHSDLIGKLRSTLYAIAFTLDDHELRQAASEAYDLAYVAPVFAGLSDEEIIELRHTTHDLISFARAIESTIQSANDSALRKLIADDAFAMTFQSLAQYRSALLSQSAQAGCGEQRKAIAAAYGYLWHINAAKDAPPEIAPPSLTPEAAAYEARKLLRDMLTKEERGQAINQVRALLAAQEGKQG